MIDFNRLKVLMKGCIRCFKFHELNDNIISIATYENVSNERKFGFRRSSRVVSSRFILHF